MNLIVKIEVWQLSQKIEESRPSEREIHQKIASIFVGSFMICHAIFKELTPVLKYSIVFELNILPSIIITIDQV